jgi:hypothetical protein
MAHPTRGHTRSLAIVVLTAFALTGSAGCQQARLVSQDAFGGVVAIPSNTNSWPDYYQDQANKLMREACKGDYVIDRREEVVVGIVRNDNTNTDTQAIPLPGKLGAIALSKTTDTTSIHDRTEHRITFHAAKVAPGTTPSAVGGPVPIPPGVPSNIAPAPLVVDNRALPNP